MRISISLDPAPTVTITSPRGGRRHSELPMTTMATVVFDRDAQHRGIAPLRTTSTTPAELAEAVHHHARAALGSRSISVTTDGQDGEIRIGSARAGRFTVHPDPAPQPAPPPPPDHIAHGYGLTDVEHLTKLSLRTGRWHNRLDIDERYNAAWFAIVERLLSSDEPPTRSELLLAATTATDDYVKDDMRTHGRCTQTYGKPMPRWHAYWQPANTPSPEPRVVERHALAQIWPRLRPSERQALAALAATGDYERAAQACGKTRGTFSVLVSSGRRRFFALWHEGETPSRQWRTDRRVSFRNGKDSQGRQRLTESQVEAYRQRRQGGELLRVLAAEAGLSAPGLSRLLSGTSKPAGNAP
jgi:hypothetical protein